MPENAADAVIELYDKNAAAWIELRGQTLFEQPWLDRFLSIALAGGRDILDLGCGSGQPIAEYLIAKGCKVTGVDGAKSLIAVARDKFPEQTWITADMRDLPLRGKFFGLIAWHSLFHLRPEDQRPMFETFSRLCHPGAALMFTSGTAHGDAIGTFENQPLYHGSLSTDDYRTLLGVNGFDVAGHVMEDPTCGGSTIWLARKKMNIA